jgi:hypothetical protein
MQAPINLKSSKIVRKNNKIHDNGTTNSTISPFSENAEDVVEDEIEPYETTPVYRMLKPTLTLLKFFFICVKDRREKHNRFIEYFKFLIIFIFTILGLIVLFNTVRQINLSQGLRTGPMLYIASVVWEIQVICTMLVANYALYMGKLIAFNI